MESAKAVFYHLSFINVYIDKLSTDLAAAKFGCHINGTCINHLIYADDS